MDKGPETYCSNCEIQLLGTYCHQCGQRDYEVRVNIRVLLKDAFTEIFEVDGRLIRTVPALFLRPGELIQSYLVGHRQRFSSPIRVYLFALLMGFLAFGYAGNRGVETYASTLESKPVELNDGKLQFEYASKDDKLKNYYVQIDVGSEDSSKYLNRQLRKLEGMNQRQAADILIGGFFDSAPTMVNLLVPLLALLLKGVHRRRVYVEHLLFSLNLHSIGLLVFGVAAIVGTLWSWTIAGLVCLLHFGIGIGRLYPEDIKWTLGKVLLVLTAYAGLLIGAFVLIILMMVSTL